MLKSVCAFLCVAAVSASTLAQPESRNVNVREVSGSLSLFVHRTELNKQMQYCVLSPHDDNNEHTANTINDMIVVDFDANPETFALCQQGAEGTFTIAQSEIASKKLDNSGCDARFAPMCLTATYDVVHAHTAKSKSDNKAASNKIAGSRKALLIEMIYLDQGPACDSTCMQNNMWSSTFNVDGLYNEASYGLLRFSQDNSRIIQLYMSSSVSDYDYCANGPQKIRIDALAALPQQYPDITVSSFNHMIMSSPALCGVAVSQVGGTLIWMNSRAPDVMAHELAHNLGRQHASTDTTNTDYSTLKSYSTDEDYGDYSCVLGYSGVGLRSFNVIHRFYMGWISSSAVVIPPTSACSAAPMQYTLASAQLPADNTYGYHAIQLNRPRGGKYFISFRAGVGYDVNAPSKWKNVVFVHYTVNSVSRTKFVAALAPGQTYADSMTGLRVAVLSTSTTQAKVEILCGATVDMCSMQMTTTKASALTGTFQQTTSLINSAPTWARSDLGAVLAYCSAKALWAVGSHDGSAVTNFDPCSAIVYKSTAYSLPSPTDADNWYSCAGTSCSADTSAVFALVSCDYVGPTSTASITRSSSVSRSRSRSASVSRTASASVSKTPSASVSPSASSTLSASLSSSLSRSLSASPSRSASVSASRSRSASMSASLSRTASASASVSRSASASASPSCGPAKKAAMTFNVDFDDSVCEYVEALCAKCEAQPGVVCTYMADLCSQCKAAE